MARHYYKGALGRRRRPGESIDGARALLVKDLGFDPATVDPWAAFDALAWRHVMGMRVEGVKFSGRKGALEPDVEEHFLDYIAEEKREAIERGELEPSVQALCEAASADPESTLFGIAPGTLRNAYSNRRERERTEQRRNHAEMIRRTEKFKAVLSKSRARNRRTD